MVGETRYEHVRRTGCWNEPALWDEASIAASGWPVDVVNSVVEALLHLFPPDVTRKVFAHVKPGALGQLLGIPWTVGASLLFRLGLDVVSARPWSHRDLIKRLRMPEAFEGARLELALLAVLRRCGPRYEYEPLRSAGGPNPDVRVEVAGQWVYIDAKQPRFSTRAAQEERWIMRMVAATPNGAQLEKLPLFAALEATDEGRRQIDHIIEDLASRVRIAATDLFAANHFPAARDVDGLVRVHVPNGQTSYALGPFDWDLDSHGDAARVVRGPVQDCAAQVPAGALGMVFVDEGPSGLVDHLVPEIARWMRDEGSTHPSLIGAVVRGHVARNGTISRGIRVVWRPSAPSAIREATLWRDLDAAEESLDR